jgi:hypothetical protein
VVDDNDGSHVDLGTVFRFDSPDTALGKQHFVTHGRKG